MVEQKRQKVSGIILCFNKEPFIERCIRSMLPQVEELIIINNASKDRSIDVINRFRGHKNLKIIDIKEQVNSGIARNKGFEAARYDHIFYVDGDLYVPPTWVEKAQEVFMGGDDIALVSQIDPPITDSFSRNLVFLLRMTERKPIMKKTDGIFYISKENFKRFGPFGTKTNLGNAKEMMRKIDGSGCNIVQLLSPDITDLDCPDSMAKLLRRQWFYGSEQIRYNKRLEPQRIGEGIAYIFLFLGFFGAIKLYPTLFRNFGRLHKSVLYAILLPFITYVFLAAYYVAYIYQSLVFLYGKANPLVLRGG